METDYLIVGAGAMSMAFADVIFNEQPDAQMVIVDRRHRPGGHWTDAYPYVALHQPAAFYGVNSAQLGQGGTDLASGPEIVSYYHLLMKRLLDSGRVRFLPMSEHIGDGRIVATADRTQITEIHARRRIVDGGFMNVEVPSTTAPRYEVDARVTLVPPNALPRIASSWERYVIAGAGKTATDAIVFLLDAGVAPERIQWISPHDSWLWMREKVQPGLALAEFMRHVESIVDARSVDDIFLHLERTGSVCRIDESVMPEKWRCATISREEFSALQRMRNQIVRLGRIRRIGTSQIELEHGSMPTDAGSLHVDCTANGLARKAPQPLFAPGRITLQSIFMCQQVFSAAIIAKLALLNLDDAARNAMCEVVPHPEYTRDHPTAMAASFRNLLNANRHMPFWLRRSRLNLLHHEALHRYLLGAARLRRLMPQVEAAVARMRDPTNAAAA
ncbi:MAG: hypothetical protein K0Q76_3536 [Panacagrimonas sp.]|jgi:hypothetical protein|nr:hypothetical protein [Panacagrimonas sp.]